MKLVKGEELYDFHIYIAVGFILRDIKPEDILLTDRSRDAQIELTDFGLSTLYYIWKSISSSAKDLISKLLELNVEERISANEALEHIWVKNPTAVINENSFIYKNEESNILNLQDVSVSTFNIPRYTPLHIEEEKNTEEIENKELVFNIHENNILCGNNDSIDEPVIPLPYSSAPLKEHINEKKNIQNISSPMEDISMNKQENAVYESINKETSNPMKNCSQNVRDQNDTTPHHNNENQNEQGNLNTCIHKINECKKSSTDGHTVQINDNTNKEHDK
ncbi:hypothetical protein PFDG_03812 [Plasmodium falciparum Dd2]|uniref:Protein kinase domain-containing protein n=1 Tax=Plasmodium falciparum (isolate Dd2) TaxID=57267 RepID=A0A0L7M3V8_PLAF4|nr:hypothetical protein PFDG_03812 [Plasmodium falciparum Dd2]